MNARSITNLYDEMKADASYGAASSGYGHGGGGYGCVYCCKKDDNDFAFLALAGFAALAGLLILLIRQAQLNGRSFNGDFSFQNFVSVITPGLEEFEEKIDQLAGGGDNGEEGWVSSLYKKFKSSFLDTTGLGDNTIDYTDGSASDNTWGLSDVNTLYDSGNSTDTGSNYRKKRSLSDVADQVESKDEPEDDYVKSLSGEAKCKTKFWRCMSKVVQSGTKYVSQTGGISGAIQKTMVKMAFHGGLGNVWNGIMAIPEARETKRCMALQEQCLNSEIIRAETKDLDKSSNGEEEVHLNTV